jgi:hypothetical protein
MHMTYEDLVRFQSTDQIKADVANNSIVDMWKFGIGTAELAFRERFARDMGRQFVPDTTVFEDARSRYIQEGKT